MSLIDPDPLTQTYDAIWDTLDAHGGFTALVKLGNRISLTDADPERLVDSLQPGDAPEARLIPTGGGAFVLRTSSNGSVVQTFGLFIVSGDQRLQIAHFPIKWEVIRAFAKSFVANGKDLGLPFVRGVALADFTESDIDFAGTKGLQGWSGLMTISTELFFTIDQLTI